MDSTLLLIHSDPEQEIPLRSAFTEAGPDVTLSFARDAEEARQCPLPKMVILDLDHPSPFEILQWLKSDQQYRDIPVIALTSSPQSEQVNQAYALGANSCLIKSDEGGIGADLARGIGTYLRILIA